MLLQKVDGLSAMANLSKSAQGIFWITRHEKLA